MRAKTKVLRLYFWSVYVSVSCVTVQRWNGGFKVDLPLIYLWANKDGSNKKISYVCKNKLVLKNILTNHAVASLMFVNTHKYWADFPLSVIYEELSKRKSGKLTSMYFLFFGHKLQLLNEKGLWFLKHALCIMSCSCVLYLVLTLKYFCENLLLQRKSGNFPLHSLEILWCSCVKTATETESFFF